MLDIYGLYKKVPGGMILIPMVLFAIINTLFPNLWTSLGDMSQALFKSGTLAFAALTWLAGVGTAAFFRLISRLIRSFRRFHRGVLLPSPDKSGKDSPAVCPDSPVKSRPRLRRACIIAAVIFALCLAAGFILCVASSGHVEFWHAWGWFGYGA